MADLLYLSDKELDELEANGVQGSDLSPGDPLCYKAAKEIRSTRKLLGTFMQYLSGNVELLDNMLTEIKWEKSEIGEFEKLILKG